MNNNKDKQDKKTPTELSLKLLELIKREYLSGFNSKDSDSGYTHRNYTLKELSNKYNLTTKQYNKLLYTARKEQWRIQRQLVQRKLALADDTTLGDLLKESTNIDRKTLCKITQIDVLLTQYIQQNEYAEEIDIKGLKTAVDCIKELHNISKEIISNNEKDKALGEEYNKRKISYNKSTEDIRNEIQTLTQERGMLEKLINETEEDINSYEKSIISSFDE
jgi:hypothetical protein